MLPVRPLASDERQGAAEVRERQRCRCDICGVEIEDGEQALAGEEEGREPQEDGEVEEGQPAKPLRQPQLPSKRIIEEHELTHCPYRSWCIHCIKSRGQAAGHYSKEAEEEEEEEEEEEAKEQVGTTWAFDYTFLTEDFELLTKTEAEAPAYKDKAKDVVMVSDDRSSGGVKAHLVECKGLKDGWIDTCTVQDISDFGYRGADIRLKCDQEPAITEVQQKVAELRKGARTVPVNSPVGDSKSNGRVENSI